MNRRIDRDFSHTHRGTRRVLQTQILKVRTQLTNLGKQTSQRAGGVVHQHRHLCERGGGSTVLTRNTAHARVAFAHQLRQIQASAGSRRVLQRRDEAVQVITHTVESLHNRVSVRRKNLHPQRRV